MFAEQYLILEQKSSNLFKAQNKVSQKQVIIKKIPFSSASSKKK